MQTITKKPFGSMNGIENFLYTLKSGNTEVDIMNFGATIVAIRTKGIDGKIYDVACGFDTPEEYVSNGGFFGAVIGRNSNRISNAEFKLKGETYSLNKNEGNNSLHSGPDGFDTKMWTATETENGLIFSYTAQDGEGGFPGKADISVTYALSKDNALSLKYHAVSAKDTIMNLTNHCYFNLNGHESGSIENHSMQINADFYTPVDEFCCPTGEILSVKNTVYDFSSPKIIADDIDNIPDKTITKGYDHNFILNTNEENIILACVTIADKSGIKMETFTNMPSVQFYAGNNIAKCSAKNSAAYNKRQGFCLETQFTPNCQIMPHLGSALLKKTEAYNRTTVYKFSTI